MSEARELYVLNIPCSMYQLAVYSWALFPSLLKSKDKDEVCVLIKDHAKKAYGRTELQFHAFLITALNGSAIVALLPRKELMVHIIV
jgi:hypothetical protein